MAKTDGTAILEAKYMARVAFKHEGKKFKSFDELTPKELNWSVKDTVNLVKAGRIMPFDNSLDAEVFHEIPYLQRKNQLGISAAEMRDIITTGKLDDAATGVFEEDLKAASKLFTTHCINQQGQKVPTTDSSVSVIPFDAQNGKFLPTIPAGADGSPYASLSGDKEASDDTGSHEEAGPTD